MRHGGGRPPESRAKLQDLQMLALFGAQEGKKAEYRALLEAAGFEHAAVHPG